MSDPDLWQLFNDVDPDALAADLLQNDADAAAAAAAREAAAEPAAAAAAAEPPYTSPFEGAVPGWLEIFPLLPIWCPVQCRWIRDLTLGEAPTPPPSITLLQEMVAKRNVPHTGTFTKESFEAVFENCGECDDNGRPSGIPLMLNEADRLAVLAYLRHHFWMAGSKVLEFSYQNGQRYYTMEHKKSDLKHICPSCMVSKSRLNCACF